MSKSSLSYFDPRARGLDCLPSTRFKVDAIFRIALSLIFVIGGLGHFGRQEWMLQRLTQSPWFEWVGSLGNPIFFLEMSGLVMIVAGISLVAGFCTRLSALALFVTLVPITFVIHIAPDHTGPLFKNIAILGALLHFIVYGSENYSVDRLFQMQSRFSDGEIQSGD